MVKSGCERLRADREDFVDLHLQAAAAGLLDVCGSGRAGKLSAHQYSPPCSQPARELWRKRKEDCWRDYLPSPQSSFTQLSTDIAINRPRMEQFDRR